MLSVTRQLTQNKASVLRVASRGFASAHEGPLLKTAMHDQHVSLGGKMVPFAGYSMPVQYPAGVIKEHKHCRTQASLFDVAHMGPCVVRGKDSRAFLESVLVADLINLPENHSSLSLLTTPEATILDDCIVTKTNTSAFSSHNALARIVDNSFFVVLNAGCKHNDLAHLNAKKFGDVKIELLEDVSLIALQGPHSRYVLASAMSAKEAEGLKTLPFMGITYATVGGVQVQISRSGYTGEDGFELACLSSEAPKLWGELCNRGYTTPCGIQGEVKPAGLGSRDSLRLEAGLCLYGNDIDTTTTIAQAGLLWTVGKRRLAEGGFHGHAATLAERAQGLKQKRVGLTIDGVPARGGTAVCDGEGNQIGRITSGGYAISIDKFIAMAYVPASVASPATKLKVNVRGKLVDATVTKLPFVNTNYYKL